MAKGRRRRESTLPFAKRKGTRSAAYAGDAHPPLSPPPSGAPAIFTPSFRRGQGEDRRRRKRHPSNFARITANTPSKSSKTS